MIDASLTQLCFCVNRWCIQFSDANCFWRKFYYSILKQKLADAATDALRCKVLQINGYDVTALELIDPEETPKNVLIRGIKKSKTNDAQINALKEEYAQICNLLGVHPYLWDAYGK